MANSIGELIMQQLAAVLNAPVDKPCTTFRTRVDAFSAPEVPAFVLYSISEEVDTQSEHCVKRIRTVRLEAIVAGVPPADSLADPLYVFAVQTLNASDLAQYMRGMEEAKIQWETEPSYEDATVAFLDFQVMYYTTTDPTVKFE